MMNSGSLALKFLVVIFSQTVSKYKNQKTDSDFFSLWGQFPTSFLSLSVLRNIFQGSQFCSDAKAPFNSHLTIPRRHRFSSWACLS